MTVLKASRSSSKLKEEFLNCFKQRVNNNGQHKIQPSVFNALLLEAKKESNISVVQLIICILKDIIEDYKQYLVTENQLSMESFDTAQAKLNSDLKAFRSIVHHIMLTSALDWCQTQLCSILDSLFESKQLHDYIQKLNTIKHCFNQSSSWLEMVEKLEQFFTSPKQSLATTISENGACFSEVAEVAFWLRNLDWCSILLHDTPNDNLDAPFEIIEVVQLWEKSFYCSIVLYFVSLVAMLIKHPSSRVKEHLSRLLFIDEELCQHLWCIGHEMDRAPQCDSTNNPCTTFKPIKELNSHVDTPKFVQWISEHILEVNNIYITCDPMPEHVCYEAPDLPGTKRAKLEVNASKTLVRVYKFMNQLDFLESLQNEIGVTLLQIYTDTAETITETVNVITRVRQSIERIIKNHIRNYSVLELFRRFDTAAYDNIQGDGLCGYRILCALLHRNDVWLRLLMADPSFVHDADAWKLAEPQLRHTRVSRDTLLPNPIKCQSDKDIVVNHFQHGIERLKVLLQNRKPTCRYYDSIGHSIQRLQLATEFVQNCKVGHSFFNPNKDGWCSIDALPLFGYAIYDNRVPLMIFKSHSMTGCQSSRYMQLVASNIGFISDPCEEVKFDDSKEAWTYNHIHDVLKELKSSATVCDHSHFYIPELDSPRDELQYFNDAVDNLTRMITNTIMSYIRDFGCSWVADIRPYLEYKHQHPMKAKESLVGALPSQSKELHCQVVSLDC